MHRALLLACLLALGKPLGAQGPGTSSVEGRLSAFDPQFWSLVPVGASLQIVVAGHDWVEGPVWDRRAGCILFSDVPRNAVYRWCEGRGEELVLAASGYAGREPFAGREPGSNGLALDSAGRLLLAEHGNRRLSRLEADGSRTTLADRFDGGRLNSPNDLVIDPRGDVLFTDPPWGLPGWWDDAGRELPFSGVYRLSPAGRLTLLTGDLAAPNGIALSPDGQTLVVSESKPGRLAWYAFEVLPDGALAGRRLLRDAAPWAAARPGAPDGLEFDEAGHLFAAGPGGVYVMDRDGTLFGVIETGRATSNVAWGGDGSDLYITAGTCLYRLRTETRGPRP